MDHPQVADAVRWFVDRQEKTGLWRLHMLTNPHIVPCLWAGLGICRVAKRLGLL